MAGKAQCFLYQLRGKLKPRNMGVSQRLSAQHRIEFLPQPLDAAARQEDKEERGLPRPLTY